MTNRIPTAIALITAAVLLSSCENTNRKTRTCTVDSKEQTVVGSGSDQRREYRIFCTDGLVLRNVDAVIFGKRWKTDSATLQAQAKVGKTYEVQTIGWRIPFLSMFPNAYSLRELPLHEKD